MTFDRIAEARTTSGAFSGGGPPASPSRTKRGFALIEIIGVLAIIAVLAALLLPKIFEAITNARISQTAINIQSTKTAVVEHHAKFGSLATSNGTALTFTGELTNFDQVLLAEGFLDKLFQTKLTPTAHVRLIQVSSYTSATSIERNNAAYDLDGDGDNDIVGASYLVDAILIAPSEADAIALNDILDGPALGANPGGNDTKGRVRYHRAVGGGSGTTGGGTAGTTGTTGNSNGGTNGNSNGGTNGNSNGGTNGNSNGGTNGNSNGGTNGNSNGGSTGSSAGGTTGGGNPNTEFRVQIYITHR
jgi:prepilin-type N-terminal cleavage/methylation domain-containing protein